MKTRFLVRAELLDGGWIAVAYGGRERILATLQATSDADFNDRLRAALEYYLATNAADYLYQMGYAGSPNVTNCPEAFIKRPVDLWACKIARQTCPIQAQVFLDEPKEFFAGCLVDEPKKQAIFNAVSQGDYRGFHHVTGRYLCPRCEEVRGNESGYNYHYPWELAALETFSDFVPDRDVAAAIPKLHHAKIGRFTVTHALCAPHCFEVATVLCPEVAATLRVIEIELKRPGVREKSPNPAAPADQKASLSGR
jgi:hypothetical protein